MIEWTIKTDKVGGCPECDWMTPCFYKYCPMCGKSLYGDKKC